MLSYHILGEDMLIKIQTAMVIAYAFLYTIHNKRLNGVCMHVSYMYLSMHLCIFGLHMNCMYETYV